MKKVLFTMLLLLTVNLIYSQTTYYWVGGTANVTNGINTGANWNTALDGSGSSRPSSTGTSDILIFDGTNLGGSAPATGPADVLGSGSISCAQMLFVNNANISIQRPTSGTSTFTINGGFGDDFFIEAGSSLNINSTAGSLRFQIVAGVDTLRVRGTLKMITGQQMSFRNLVTAPAVPATFIFESGSSFTTNITSSSSSYAFGNSSQSTEKWVQFQDGAHLYYEGGYSPNGSSSAFSPIQFMPGSFWHHRAASGAGSFFNKRHFGNIIVENGATLAADGPIYAITNLTINSGCTFTTHTSGETVVMGNLTVDGSLTADPTSTNAIVMSGDGPQTIGGSGSISVGRLTVADKAVVSITSSLVLEQSANIYGHINFGTSQLTGNGQFHANGVNTVVAGTGNTTTGSYLITGNSGIPAALVGYSVSGPGIAPNSVIVGFSVTDDTIYVSKPLLADAAATSISVASSGATLETANSNGFDPASGSVSVAGNKSYDDNINYIINAATTVPFGISTNSVGNRIHLNTLVLNAAVTANAGITVTTDLLLNGKLTLRPLDTVHIVSGATISGSFSSSNYIATDYNPGNGNQSIVQVDAVTAATTVPIGTVANYLPVTLSPASGSDFAVAVFEEITTNGTITGTPLTALQKQTVVNAVWNINRLTGSGNADLQLGWDASLEGSTFATLPDLEIGMIKNTGSSWDLPIGTGDNTANFVAATVTAFGAFSAGAVPQTQPFVFNPLPVKTYGDADFNGGATSLNTTQPIIYSSNNPAVATIISGDIHIVGAGTAQITASQASDGFYPAASVTQTLTVDKASLLIKADDITRFEGVANPTLTLTYISFVLGESVANLTTAPVVATTATIASAPGQYPITVSGATSGNYEISFADGTLTVQPKQNQVITFPAPATKTYGNADFSTGASSTNNTIPITYTSSNTAVATITGNTIHITGAGTTTITAMQAGNDGYFPATDVVRTLTVNKAALSVRVNDATKTTGEANPPFTLTYTGFVLGETATNLTTQPQVVTSATANSSPGYYTLSAEGAVTQNYNITYVDGRLTILPLSGTDKQYMNAYRNSNGNITVRIYSDEPHLADIVVYDMNGRPFATKNIFMPVGFASVEIPAQLLPSGMYVVAVRGDGVKLEKIINFLR